MIRIEEFLFSENIEESQSENLISKYKNLSFETKAQFNDFFQSQGIRLLKIKKTEQSNSQAVLERMKNFKSSVDYDYVKKYIIRQKAIADSIRTENLTKHSQKIIYIALLVTCFLWSSESLIYGLAISGLYSFFRMMNSGSKFIVLAPALSIISSIFLINVYTLIKTKNLADLDMFFMYSKSYSEGYGSLPLLLFSPLLVIYMIIFCTIFFTISSKENSSYLELIYLSSFALLIWITYYLGRAVSNNIMVLLPIFFLFFVQNLSQIFERF